VLTKARPSLLGGRMECRPSRHQPRRVWACLAGVKHRMERRLLLRSYGQCNPACLYRVPEIVTRGRFPARRVVTVLMDWWLGPAAPRTLRRECVGLSVAGPSRGDSLTARPGRASPSLGQRKREVNIGEGALGASCPPEMVIQSHLDATGGLAMPTTIRDCYRRSRPDRRWGAGYLPLAQRRNV
jgi:hypothetical protein